MKKIILSLSCCVLFVHAQAQNKLYLIASGAAGLSSAKYSYSMPIDQTNISGLAGFNAQAKIGYHLRKWRLEAGLQYKITGYKQELEFANSQGNSLGMGSLKSRFPELSVIANFGYQIPLNSRFMLVPYAGFSSGVALGLHYTSVLPDQTTHSDKVDSKTFDNSFHKVNFWTNTAVHVEYKASERFSIAFGPSFQYMLNNAQKEAKVSSIFNEYQHNYLLAMDLGVKYNF